MLRGFGFSHVFDELDLLGRPHQVLALTARCANHQYLLAGPEAEAAHRCVILEHAPEHDFLTLGLNTSEAVELELEDLTGRFGVDFYIVFRALVFYDNWMGQSLISTNPWLGIEIGIEIE